MSRSDESLWREQVAAYLLDSLPPGEVRELETHLEGCERCRQYRQWLGEAVGLLPQSVAPLEPPADLRRRILTAARAEVPVAREVKQTWWQGLGLRPALAGAAAALALAAGLGGYLLGEPGAPQTRTTHAGSEIPGSSVDGTLVRSGDLALVRIEHLPRLRARRVYQLWLRRDEDIRPSTVFVVNREGRASAAIPSGIAGTDEVMVSEEPEGGSRAPTSEPLLKLPLR